VSFAEVMFAIASGVAVVALGRIEHRLGMIELVLRRVDIKVEGIEAKVLAPPKPIEFDFSGMKRTQIAPGEWAWVGPGKFDFVKQPKAPMARKRQARSKP